MVPTSVRLALRNAKLVIILPTVPAVIRVPILLFLTTDPMCRVCVLLSTSIMARAETVNCVRVSLAIAWSVRTKRHAPNASMVFISTQRIYASLAYTPAKLARTRRTALHVNPVISVHWLVDLQPNVLVQPDSMMISQTLCVRTALMPFLLALSATTARIALPAWRGTILIL